MREYAYDQTADRASEDPITTAWGSVVLEDELDVFHSLDNGAYDKIFGVLCRLVGAHKGGHIAWSDLERGVYGAADAIGRDRGKVRLSLEKALREVAPRGPASSNAANISADDGAPIERPETPWPNLLAIHAMWSRTVPCALDDDSYHWLMLRGISPQRVEWQQLARFLPHNATNGMAPEEVEAVRAVLPKTKIGGELDVATRLGFRILLPVYDAEGVRRSLRLRRPSIDRDKRGNARLREQPKGQPKELGLKGRAKGAVLANGTAVHLLRNRGAYPGELRVVIAEGSTDFLVACSEPADMPTAVFGIVGAGSWSADIAKKIPSAAEVILATDSDKAGESYAEAAAAMLPGQAKLSRWRPWSANKHGRSKHDLGEVFGLRGGRCHAL